MTTALSPQTRPAPAWFSTVSGWGLALLKPFFPPRWIAALEHAAWFLAVGTFNTASGYLLFVLCLNVFHFSRSLSLVIIYAFGMVLTYQTFSRLVFIGGARGLVACLRFVPSYVLLFLCNHGLLTLLVWLSGWSEELAQFILLPVVALLSYGINRFIVFGGKTT